MGRQENGVNHNQRPARPFDQSVAVAIMTRYVTGRGLGLTPEQIDHDDAGDAPDD